MPIYEYECQDPTCGIVFSRLDSIKDRKEIALCKNCGFTAKLILSKININTAKGKARVFYQYKGDPNSCPPDLREAIKSQDRPDDLPDFSKEGMAVVTDGQRQDGFHYYK